MSIVFDNRNALAYKQHIAQTESPDRGENEMTMNTTIPSDIAALELSPFPLIDASGDAIGYATWEQVDLSLAASPEGWIEVDGQLDCYVEGDEDEMRADYEEWLNT